MNIWSTEQAAIDQNGVHGGTTGKVENMEITDENERPVVDYGVDRDYGVWH